MSVHEALKHSYPGREIRKIPVWHGGAKTALEELRKQGREKPRVEARSLAIYWAVCELGIDGMTLARRYYLTQPAIVHAARRGEKITKEKNRQ